MKYRISSQYREQIYKYLDGKGIPYKTYQQQQYFYIQISQPFNLIHDTTSQCTTNKTHRIAQILLKHYQYQKQHNKQTNIIGIQQWIPQFTKQLQNKIQRINKSNLCSRILDKNLQEAKMIKLRKQLQQKHQFLQKQVKSYKQSEQKYKIIGALQQKRIGLAAQNIRLRAKLGQNKKQESQDQLGRIEAVLKNGLWGNRDKLQQKLKKIRQLQQQIKQIKG